MEKRGLCMCGCGQPTAIAKGTDSRRGNVQGEPQKYIFGHAARKSPTEYASDETTGCWLWQRALNNLGYGRASRDGKPIYAHRLFWERTHGPLLEGQCVLHKCDTPACVNPEHLFVGSMLDNSRDMVAKGRSTRGTRHYRATLREPDVIDIRRRRSRGEPAKQIAAEFGVSRQTVNDIFAWRSWTHIQNCERG